MNAAGRPVMPPPLADPADRTAMWRAALLRCPYCGALVLPDDMAAHGDAHRKHDREHEEIADG